MPAMWESTGDGGVLWILFSIVGGMGGNGTYPLNWVPGVIQGGGGGGWVLNASMVLMQEHVNE